MYSLLLLPLVIANTVLVVWLARSTLRYRDWVLVLTLVLVVMLPYDTAIVMLGGSIGEGDLLRALNAPRFNWFYLTAPLLPLIAFGIARRAGLAWTQANWGLGVLGVLALGIIVYDAPRMFQAPALYPACFEDVLRYVPSVKPEQACAPGQAGIDVAGSPPWASLAGMLLMLAVGVWLWWQRRWRWLVLGPVAGAVVLGLSNTPIGPLNTFFGDFLTMGSILWTAIHFSTWAAEKKRRRTD
jgi:hypothetical protein